jgi:hypothetical protein
MAFLSDSIFWKKSINNCIFVVINEDTSIQQSRRCSVQLRLRISCPAELLGDDQSIPVSARCWACVWRGVGATPEQTFITWDGRQPRAQWQGRPPGHLHLTNMKTVEHRHMVTRPLRPSQGLRTLCSTVIVPAVMCHYSTAPVSAPHSPSR